MTKQYEIWRAKVVFEDAPDIVKERPVLIINENMYFIMAQKLTGTDRGDNEDEMPIKYWREAGLDKETHIRLSKLLKLQKNDLVSKVGKLDDRDIMRFELRIASRR